MSEKPFDHYLPFDVLDFVMDDDFQDWARRPTPEREAYWQAFLAAFPQKTSAVDTARQALGGLRVSDWQTVPPHQLHERFRQLETRLHADRPEARVLPMHRRWWARAAAVLLLGLFTALAYRYGWAETTYQTAYGQQERVILTDQTVVTLAANSRLRVPGRWQFRQNREVWLTGEAYFEVTKQPDPSGQRPGRKFLVHARDLDVEVLGTRFNVNTLRSKTTVLLDEGRVRLLSAGRAAQPVLLRPGQLAELVNPRRGIRVQPADPALTAWRDNQLHFRAATLAELAQRVGEVYGLSLVFDGEGWQEVEFTGVLPARDADLTQRILSETLGAEVVREGDRLIFRKSTP